MNWLPAFGAWQFAAAGAVAGAMTVLIHLLNRRRYQVLPWGAIEFLQQAIKKKRRAVQLRDRILLALRTLAVLLFGLALARPHYTHRDSLAGPLPIHAIVVVDNSLSMSYRTLEGSLLGQARQAARNLVERLPAGSHVSVLTSCGALSADDHAPTTDLPNAIQAIERIKVADTTASIREMLARARTAARVETNQPPRVIILTDQQAVTWDDVPQASELGELDQLQIVDLAPRQRDNTWVSEITVQDGFAESRTPATIRVEIQRSGGSAIRHAEVALLVDEQLVGSRSIALQAGQSQQQVTFEHAFLSHASQELIHLPVKAVLTPDRLPIDDTRHLLVPVLPRLPIVFVDAVGAGGEEVRLGRLGETRPLRRLLDSDREEDLREVALGLRHVKFDELDAAVIQDARVVIVAGVESPGEKVSVLRKFVAGGGQLLIAAGGDFSAVKWQELAWLDGNGILPAPLTGAAVGLPLRDRAVGEPAVELPNTSLLSFDSLRGNAWLRLPGIADTHLHDLYTEPLFFRWIEIDTSPALASAYHVLARLDDAVGAPLLVEREVDQGRVMFFSSGLLADWNTLAMSNAVVMLDRLVRELIRATLEDRTRAAGGAIEVELPIAARDATVVLQRPQESTAVPIVAAYLDRERFGVTIRDVNRRGIYRLAAVAGETNAVRRAADPIWEQELAINGDAVESDLTPVGDAPLAALARQVPINVVHSGDDVFLADTESVTHGLWWWVVLVVLVLVLAETLTLAAAQHGRRADRSAEWAA